MLVDLGHDTTVKYDEVIAVHDGFSDEDRARLLVAPHDGPRSVVILRGNQLIPAYVTGRTVRRRLEEARQAAGQEGGGE